MFMASSVGFVGGVDGHIYNVSFLFLADGGLCLWDMAMRGLFCSIALVCISGVRLDFSRLRHNSTHFLGVAVLCGISRPRCNDFGLSLLATLLSFASAFLPSFPDSLRWGVQRRRAMQRVNG